MGETSPMLEVLNTSVYILHIYILQSIYTSYIYIYDTAYQFPPLFWF